MSSRLNGRSGRRRPSMISQVTESYTAAQSSLTLFPTGEQGLRRSDENLPAVVEGPHGLVRRPTELKRIFTLALGLKRFRDGTDFSSRSSHGHKYMLFRRIPNNQVHFFSCRQHRGGVGCQRNRGVTVRLQTGGYRGQGRGVGPGPFWREDSSVEEKRTYRKFPALHGVGKIIFANIEAKGCSGSGAAAERKPFRRKAAPQEKESQSRRVRGVELFAVRASVDG